MFVFGRFLRCRPRHLFQFIVLAFASFLVLLSGWRLLRRSRQQPRNPEFEDIAPWKPHKPKTILVATPDSHVPWNGDLARSPGSATGISGTHTALLAIAERFARQGWMTHIIGTVLPTRRWWQSDETLQHRPNYVHHKADINLVVCPDGIVDVVISSSSLQWYERCPTRLLLIIMEGQFAFMVGLWRYVKQQHLNVFNFTVVFVHLSSWGERVFRRFHQENWLVLGEKQGWVQHRNDVFRNPVPVDVIREIAQKSGPRKERSMIFHALMERGGSLAAKVFKQLSKSWGSDARGIWVSYSAGKGEGAERQAIKDCLHDHPGASLLTAGMSKPNLFAEMARSGFFVYGLASRDGLIHYDTFANVVAESLASGILVLAPPLAALPELYGNSVTWVEPRGGLNEQTRHAIQPVYDSSLKDDDMVQGYVDAITGLMTNSTRRKELQARGLNVIQERFSEENVTASLYKFVVETLAH